LLAVALALVAGATLVARGLAHHVAGIDHAGAETAAALLLLAGLLLVRRLLILLLCGEGELVMMVVVGEVVMMVMVVRVMVVMVAEAVLAEELPHQITHGRVQAAGAVAHLTFLRHQGHDVVDGPHHARVEVRAVLLHFLVLSLPLPWRPARGVGQ